MIEPAPSKTFAVTYHFVPDIVEKRDPYREAHRERLRHSERVGLLLTGGAFSDPFDGALLIVRGQSLDEVRAWADQDPYVEAGLVSGISVRRMTITYGNAKNRGS
jgi:hypothetical protein